MTGKDEEKMMRRRRKKGRRWESRYWQIIKSLLKWY